MGSNCLLMSMSSVKWTNFNRQKFYTNAKNPFRWLLQISYELIVYLFINHMYENSGYNKWIHQCLPVLLWTYRIYKYLQCLTHGRDLIFKKEIDIAIGCGAIFQSGLTGSSLVRTLSKLEHLTWITRCCSFISRVCLFC